MKITLPLLVLLLGAPCLAVPLSVSVVDDKGDPIVGADVQFQSYLKVPAGTVMTTTNAQGMASFEGEPASKEDSFAGRVAVWKNELALGGGNLMFQKPLKVVLRPSNTVSGTLLDENKRPIAGATVRFSSYRSPQGSMRVYLFDGPLQEKMQTVSNADGSWKLAHLPPEVSVNLSVQGTNWTNEAIQIPSGGSIQTTLRPDAKIAGRLLGLDGKPLAGIRVYATEQKRDFDKRSFAESKTGEDGTFRLVGLEKGTYRVGFDSADDAPFVVATFENIEGTAEKAVQLPDARAVPGVLVSGRVVSRNTKAPVEGVYIGLLSGDVPDSTSSTRTDSKGNWQIRTLAKTGKLYLQGTPSEFIRNNEQRIAFDVQNQATNLNFELVPATKITGRVVDENGRAVQTQSLSFRQKYEDYSIQTDANGNFITYGPQDGEVEVGRPMWAGEEGENAEQWDVVGVRKFTIPSAQPLEIKVKKAEMSSLELGVFDQEDAGIEGAKVVIMLMTRRENGGGTSTNRTLISDKTGRAHLEGIRADQEVSIQNATKEGFDPTPWPKIEKTNGMYQADITLSRRGGQAKGQLFDSQGTASAGADLFGSGIETKSDATGHFLLTPLPSGKTDILAWKGDSFALAPSDATRLELHKQTLVPTDALRAKELMAALKEESRDTKYYYRDSLSLDISSGDFDADAEQTLATGTFGGTFGLFRLIKRYASDANIPVEKWVRVLQSPKKAEDRLYSVLMWNSLVPSVKATEATRNWLRLLEADVARTEKVGDASNRWQNAVTLFGPVALAERMGETQKADELFEHANAYIQRTFPEKGDDRGNPSQDDAYGAVAEMVAVSPRLLSKLVEQVEPESGAYSRLLQDGSPLVARFAGLSAAKPFLETLKKAPPAKPDSQGNSPSIEWAQTQGVISSIREGGQSNPQLALELAQLLPAKSDSGYGNERARAVVEAAFFQSPEVAQALWRDSLPKLDAGDAMRFIVRIAQRDEPLARSFYEKAREEFDALPNETEDPMIYRPERQVAVFAFYEARFDPARARYRLEKGFQSASKAEDYRYGLSNYARVMALFDTERALVWANQLGNKDNNYAGFESKRSIARWLALDEAARSNANMGNRFGRSDDDFKKLVVGASAPSTHATRR